MRQHFSYLPSFLYAVAHKFPFYVGIGVGIIYTVVAYLTSLDAGTVITIGAGGRIVGLPSIQSFTGF